jgi:hypothetical protein
MKGNLLNVMVVRVFAVVVFKQTTSLACSGPQPNFHDQVHTRAGEPARQGSPPTSGITVTYPKNRQGKTRLSKWYVPYDDDEKVGVPFTQSYKKVNHSEELLLRFGFAGRSIDW